jgi:choice-of-anchor B domain-containing protein
MRTMAQRFLALLLTTACSFAIFLQAQVTKNVTLLSQVTYPSSSYNLAGVFSYAQGGKEYALVGVYDGLSIVDVTVPATPVELFHLNHTTGVVSTWHEIRTWDHYAYVSNETGDGIRIIDLQYLPDSVHFKDIVLDSMPTAHTVTIDEKGYLYVNGGTWPRQGMGIFDLNPDPWNPVQVGAWHDRYIHDQYVRNDTAYVAEILDGLLEIIDLSDRSNPVVIGSKSYINSFTHNTWLNDAGTVCFTTDELNQAYIYSWDITDPGNITQLDGIRASTGEGMGIPHNVQVLNDYLVTSYYTDGLHIVDAARPHNLIEVGYYDHYPSASGFQGFWGADPFLPSGTVLASDMFDGLYVFQVDYRRGCYLEGIVTDSVTGGLLSGVQVTLGTTVDASNANGFYATGVADSASVSVTYALFGYEPKTVTYTLDNGVVTNGDVQLVPMNRYPVTVRVVDAASGAPIPGAEVRFYEDPHKVDLHYVTNASGEVLEPAMVGATFDVHAGIWGHIPEMQTVGVDSLTGSIVFALDRGYADNFALDLGWQADPFPAGEWERGEPVGTYNGASVKVNPEVDVNTDFGQECFVTSNAGGGPYTSDVDGGPTVLHSPVMDLSTMVKPVLKFHRWFYNGGPGGPLDDTLAIEISNGTATQMLKQVYGFSSDFWKQDTFDLKALLPSGFLNSTVTVNFLCSDNGVDHLVDAGLDNFSLLDQAPVGVEDAVAHQTAKMLVSPNPTGSQAVVHCELPGVSPGADLTFELHDLSGRLLEQRSLSAAEKLDIPLPMPYAQGVYFASLVMDGQVLKVVKVVR